MKTEHIIVGVVGLKMGKNHLKSALKFGAEVGAICDPDTALLEAVCEEFQIPAERCFTDYRAMLAAHAINAVIIASPDMVHREQVEAFLAAGVHILCEKPLALTRKDLVAIVQAGRAHPECKLMVGQICRFTPAFVKAKELVDAGRIGELYFVESEYAHDYQKMFEGDVPNWRAHPDRHGVVGGGCHAVDLLRWIVGADPTEVFAYGTHKLLPQVPYDDATVALMKFPGDVMGKVFVSTGCKRNYTMRTVLYGTKGTLIFDNKSPTMQLFEADEQGHTPKEPQVIEITLADHNADAEFVAFGKAVLEDLPLEMTAEEGARTVAACLAIVESSERGGVVYPNYSM